MQVDAENNVYDTPEIREALLGLTQDSSEEVRFEAFRGLGALREKRAAPLLLQAMEASDCLYDAMVEAAGRIADPLLAPLLQSWLDDIGDDESNNLSNALAACKGERKFVCYARIPSEAQINASDDKQF